ncbi:helix-turn-helix transcriptional regulator, partial [Mycobacterium sp. ITM-2017-0098]
MTSTAPHRPTDLLPAAREAIALVDADPRAPTKLLVTGGIGTGKSAALASLRTSFRSSGRPVSSRSATGSGAADAVVVVDDADLLDDAELDRLTELVAQPDSTVVVGAQPLVHRPSLRRLAAALERENPAVVLGPVPAVEAGRAATAVLGAPVPPDLVRLLMSVTGGIPFLLRAALAVLDEGPAGVRQAARFALIDRLRRLDERLLDTLLVSSLGSGLGPDDVAAALHMPSEAALAAVDRAR